MNRKTFLAALFAAVTFTAAPLALSRAPGSHDAAAASAGHAQRTRVEHTRDDRAARAPICRHSPGDAFARTELFFGLSRPGGVIGEAEFKTFVDEKVTPRFPDGLTLLTGTGQFRDASGTTISEGSKLLILLVPRQDREADSKIEAIRRDYLAAFDQQSVLRADGVSCVSF
jgi:hypothetical protein